jgi:hypothetical protein
MIPEPGGGEAGARRGSFFALESKGIDEIKYFI